MFKIKLILYKNYLIVIKNYQMFYITNISYFKPLKEINIFYVKFKNE